MVTELLCPKGYRQPKDDHNQSEGSARVAQLPVEQLADRWLSTLSAQ